MPAVQDKAPLLKRRRTDSRRPAPADDPRKIRYGNLTIIEPAEGGGRGKRDLRSAPKPGMWPGSGVEDDLRTARITAILLSLSLSPMMCWRKSNTNWRRFSSAHWKFRFTMAR